MRVEHKIWGDAPDFVLTRPKTATARCSLHGGNLRRVELFVAPTIDIINENDNYLQINFERVMVLAAKER